MIPRSSPLEVAGNFFKLGWMPLPVPFKSKNPSFTNWSQFSITESVLSKHFGAKPQNIGVLLGTPSRGLVDIDLDCAETVLLAPLLLPDTGSTFGRESKRRSHWLYYSDLTTQKFCDPILSSHNDKDQRKKAMLVEIRSTGTQTLFPGSTHPSGEAITWDTQGEPTQVASTDLIRAVAWLASAALLARYWPEGARHHASLALAGWLLRAGWTPADSVRLIEAVCQAASDEEARSRVVSVVDTAAKLKNGEKATGLPTLLTLIDKRIVNRVREWLGLQAERVHNDALPKEPTEVDVEWPSLDETALYGLAGDFVRLIEPHSESDPAALLAQFLSAAGNVIGRSARFLVEADKHFMNIFVVLVGGTGTGRKGTSWGHVKHIFELVDEDWARNCLAGGMSSGEGLVYHVRDAMTVEKPIKADGKATGLYETIIADKGVTDKRLLVYEGEFASVIRAQGREGNTLSMVIRNLWDTGDTRSMVKNSPTRTTGAHVSIIGHITIEELRSCLDAVESVNGYVNRFMWFLVGRSKYLPRGGKFSEENLAPLILGLRSALDNARTVNEMSFNEDAWALWDSVYISLETGRIGLLGKVTQRASPYVLRLSCLYALLDCSPIVKREHLEAALAVWKYAEQSARRIFGGRIGDRVADDILSALREAGNDGLTQTELNNLFHGHRSSGAINAALNMLLEVRLITSIEEPTAGRPTKRWFSITLAAEKAEKEEKVDKPSHHQETSFAYSSYSAPVEMSEPLNEEEEEFAARLEFMEHIPRAEAELIAKEWFAPVPF